VNTIKIGDISESKVLSRFLELGYTVLLPWGNGERYDLVIEREGKFLRIQVKTGRIYHKTGIIRCPMYNINGSSRQRMRYDSSEIDYFAIYCPDNDKTYLVDVREKSSSEIHLRFTPPKNNQRDGINWAKDFEL
jgi:hypothetical protein